jgi:hypothetical protein
MRRAGPPLILTAVLVLVSAALFLILRAPERPRDPLDPLADSIRVLRAAADTCRTRIDEARTQLDRFDSQLDSLHARLRALERIDPRGIPSDSYAAYLETFDRYNDSVPGWTARADALRASWSRCRDLTALHNALADSLRRELERQMERMRRESGR